MEVWVRNQNKEEFVRVKSISCCYMDKKRQHRIVGYCGGEDLYFMGDYKSKERCLEIIDEIQKLLCQEKSVVVYEMPKE